jgi:NIMA (never in mitosis gene a)-related kinase
MDKYEKIRVLGRGSYGLAWLVKRKEDGTLLVLKEIELGSIDEEEKFSALNEIKILSTVSHQNIVKMHDNFQFGDNLCLVVDYCEGGDLNSVIKAAKTYPLREQQIVDWFLQICLAIKYLHERNILHRDIKAQNILLTERRRIIKVGDFGIAKALGSSVLFTKSSVGSL